MTRDDALGCESAGSEFPQVLLLGAGGHAAVVLEALLALGLTPFGLADKTLSVGALWEGIPVIGRDEDVWSRDPKNILLVNCLGANPHCTARNNLFFQFKSRGFRFFSFRHPSAVVARNVFLAEGSQVMAGSVLQSGVRVGENVVVNTRVSVDHHCELCKGAFISPGAVLCGGVTVGEGAFLGAGCVLLPGIVVGARAIVGAGAVVLRDVACEDRVVGNPAKSLRKNSFVREC